MHILFLCTGNSCRSIIAEAIFNSLAPEGFKASSAGSQPTGKVHPEALEMLTKAGINTQGLHSKSWDSINNKVDIVITLCASAAGEACPLYVGDSLKVHWGLPDPAGIPSAKERAEAFEQVFTNLKNCIQSFLALPHKELRTNPELFLQSLQDIGKNNL